MANPISVLFEFSLQRGYQAPQFELKSQTGESHNPLFLMEIKLGNWKAEASGASKQKAKHAAAKALFDKLTENNELTNALPESESSSETALCPVSQLDVKRIKKNIVSQDMNAVGRLQELCMSKNWPIPIYKDVSVSGPAHQRSFILACEVGTLHYNGCGQTKKQAKHDSASKMFEHLESSPDLSTKVINDCFYVDETKLMLKNEPKKMITNCFPGAEPIIPSTSLKCESIDIEPHEAVDKLTELISKVNLEVTYIEIEKKSYHKLHQCLVRLRSKRNVFVSGSDGIKDDPELTTESDAVYSGNEDSNEDAEAATKPDADCSESEVPKEDAELNTKPDSDCSGSEVTKENVEPAVEPDSDCSGSEVTKEDAELTTEPDAVCSGNEVTKEETKRNTKINAVCFGSGITKGNAKQAAAYDAIMFLDVMTDIDLT